MRTVAPWNYAAGIVGPGAAIRVSYSRAPEPSLAVRELSPAAPRQPRLLDRVRASLRARHGSRRTEKAYVAWIRRYILFHGKRHPADMARRQHDDDLHPRPQPRPDGRSEPCRPDADSLISRSVYVVKRRRSVADITGLRNAGAMGALARGKSPTVQASHSRCSAHGAALGCPDSQRTPFYRVPATSSWAHSQRDRPRGGQRPRSSMTSRETGVN